MSWRNNSIPKSKMDDYDDDVDHNEAHNETSRLLGIETVSPAATPHHQQADSWAGAEEFVGLPWHKRPSVFWLIPPYALFTLAFGGSIVPKLNLIITLVCDRYFREKSLQDQTFVFTPVVLGGDNPQCNIPEVQQNVATFTLVMSVIVGVLSSYTAPKIGSLSDRYGRKKVLALTSAGGVCAEVVTILCARFPDVIHYQWLLVGVVFDGLAGSFTAGSFLSHAYTSDCTPPSKRGVAIGYLHACLFSGLAFGPLIAAYFIKFTGSIISLFYVTLCCHIIFILFVGFIIPESVSERRQELARKKHREETHERDQRTRAWAANYMATHQGRPANYFMSRLASPKYANLLASIRSANPLEPLRVLSPKGHNNIRARRNLILLAVTDMIILGAAMSSGQVTLLYAEYMFNWGNFETSEFMSIISLVRVCILLLLFPAINYVFRVLPARRRRRESGATQESNAGADKLDISVLRFAILSDVVGIIGYVFARSESFFIASGVITAFGGMSSATIQAMLSKTVPAETVGSVLGAIGLLHALSRIVAPVVLNGLYAATVKTFPQAVFVVISGLFVVVFILSLMLRPHGTLLSVSKCAKVELLIWKQSSSWRSRTHPTLVPQITVEKR